MNLAKENIKYSKKDVELYNELNNLLNDYFSYNLYTCCETLLNIVRNENFVTNDIFECAYLSVEDEKDKAVEEFKKISKFLIKKGYKLEIFNSCIQVSKLELKSKLKIYCSWLDSSMNLIFSESNVGKRFKYKTNKLELETRVIEGNNILVPKVYKDILNQIYGEGWQKSNFIAKPLDKHDGFMDDIDMNEVYWEQYYLNLKKQKPSTFCSFINDFVKKRYLILDIGCGSARDSFEFAQRGHKVVGIDRSEQAIRFANLINEQEGYENIKFEIGDISNKNLMDRIFKNAKHQIKGSEENTIYYSRFFLHSIDEESQNKLLEVIANNLDKGDLFIAEFRTKEDEERQKVYSNHYRRFIDKEILLNQLAEICKLDKVLLSQKGTGLSIYKDEDPFLARIIVEKE